MRSFVVLTRNGVGWIEQQTIDAITANHAIEQVADQEGDYIAVEARYFQPATVAPKTVFAVVKDPQPA